MLGFPDERGQRGRSNRGQMVRHGTQHGGGHNPFDLMDSRMSQMMTHMDAMSGFGRGGGFGGMGGGMGGMGGMMSAMDQMMGMNMGMGMGAGPTMGGGGLGGGSSYSYSSCSYCSSSGAGGPSVEYSSTSHGVQRPGEEMVHETHRNYRDSSGQERLGVSRHIGDRGRSVVAERGADGRETRTDNLVNIQDGSSFDREWRANASASAINQTRANTRAAGSAFGAAPMLGSSMMGAPALTMGARAQPRPQQSDADRAAAREGARAYENERERIISEARRQRAAAEPPSSHRASRRAAPGAPASRIDGRSSDGQLAARLARDEARNAGLY